MRPPGRVRIAPEWSGGANLDGYGMFHNHHRSKLDGYGTVWETLKALRQRQEKVPKNVTYFQDPWNLSANKLEVIIFPAVDIVE